MLKRLMIRVLNANVSLEVPLQLYLERTDLWNDCVNNIDLETFQVDDVILLQHTYVVLRGLEKRQQTNNKSPQQQNVSNIQTIEGQRQKVQTWFDTTTRSTTAPKVIADKKGDKPKIQPLYLHSSTSILININEDQRTASILIYNCRDISHKKSLVFRCNEYDLSNNTLSNDCTYTCYNLEPGSIYNALLVRLPIRIVDKTDDEQDNIFQEETLNQVYTTNLDKVKNLIFVEDPIDKNKTFIYFNRPYGSYHQISISCYELDQYCLNNNIYLMNTTGNCSHCTFISIFPMLRGMKYKCQAKTIKDNFADKISDEYNFNSSLEPILYNGLNDFNTSTIYLNVIPQSDFSSIELICIVDDDTTYSCLNLTVATYSCSTSLYFVGIRGCNYKCHFVTKKYNYNNAISNEYRWIFFPPKSNLFEYGKGSRWILIRWTINEFAYIQSFDLFINQNRILNIDNSTFSYNCTNLLPNRNYELYIRLNSNYQVLSDQISVKTLEEAPLKPTDYEIQTKIVLQDNDDASTTEQHVIEIDRSLFSNDYGIVLRYLIYVRQDQSNFEPSPYFVGTYDDAWQNSSVDYLAQIIYLDSSINSNKFRMIIGNETRCWQSNDFSIPCNGKLKPNKIYKIIVGGCASVDCTYVLSRSFQTKIENKPRPSSSSSKAWISVFPILAVLIPSIGLIIWKRDGLKRCCIKKQKKENNNLNIADLRTVVPASYVYNFQEIKSKPLIQYINLTDEDKTNINDEFQVLKNLAPQSDQSMSSSHFDRYNDISSRGPWKETAVHLIGNHRKHDYINANEIRGVNSLKQYIACQSPLKNTCEDFWDMIIQYKITKIVMLNQFDQENLQDPSSSAQCYPYIPMNKNETLDFNTIKITVNNIEYYLDNQLEIRRLHVQKSKKQYDVIHFLFTNWSKFGTIDCRTLIDLTEIVNQYDQVSINLLPPIVVHCSSGTGRTGTYIAVDIITHLLDLPNEQLIRMKLDIMGIVNQLKHDRAKMVQTEQQYLLIHHCIEEYLKKTNRLNLIINAPNTYETIPDSLSKLRDRRYINLSDSKHNSKVNSSSIIDHVVNEINKNISERTENNEQELIDEHEYDYVQ
ncbi:unnamed protein product [Rotaria sp. Silwood1]|nr:unnamed protein product [Rotaria sp. Silwood1]